MCKPKNDMRLNELKLKKKIVPVMHISVRHGIFYNFSSDAIHDENKDKKPVFYSPFS